MDHLEATDAKLRVRRDLEEFNQKEDKSTRWGTKEVLLQASTSAKKYAIGIIIDAVLNVIPQVFKKTMLY